MIEKSKESFGKPVIGAILFGLSFLFGIPFALILKLNFFIFVIVTFAALLFLFTSYSIAEYVWSKLPLGFQDNAEKWGIGLFLLAVFVLAPSGMIGGGGWNGEGRVNLFPEGAVSKNYRVTADITVKEKWWWKKEYVIESVDWPNEGYSRLLDCTIGGGNDTCTDDEGRAWRIEIEVVPSPPERSD
jgi:hypothetical protein